MKKYSQLIRHQGNSSLFDIIDISILGTLSGVPVHIHAEGLRGTGKTTIIRASKGILPKIERIRGCLYNCDPKKPHCPEHSHLTPAEIEKIGVEIVDMPFLEISPSAKKGTVVGSIDLKKLSSKEHPEAALLLGTIPKAHRGIIFVDEINRIADTSPELADILLDVMGTKPGRLQIEEVGLPTVEIPVQVSVWAASNPDEDPGPLEEIRRQLSDRFDFAVNVERPVDVDYIKRILNEQHLPVDSRSEKEKMKMLLEAKKIINNFVPAADIHSLLASLYVNFGLESLRGIESILLGVNLRGALLRKTPDIDDVIFVARYALRHRTDAKTLNDILKSLEQSKSLQEKSLKATKPLPEDESTKTSTSRRAGENKKMASRKMQDKFFNGFEQLLSRLKNGFKSKSKNPSPRSIDPKDVEIKAPPQKALPIKELDITEYVKTEEELG
jgi:magnesium chelatase subunit I